jgi:hypothetical protein
VLLEEIVIDIQVLETHVHGLTRQGAVRGFPASEILPAGYTVFFIIFFSQIKRIIY